MSPSARAESVAVAADFVRHLFVLFKAASVYRPDNAGYRVHATLAAEALAHALEQETELRLETREETLFLNERAVDARAGNSASARFLSLEMARRGVGAILFTRAAGEKGLDALAYAFAGVARDAGFEDVSAALARTPGPGVVLLPPPVLETTRARTTTTPPRAGAEQAKRTFFRAVDTVERMMTGLREHVEPELDEAKTAVQDLAAQVVADEQALFELSLLQHFDEYTYAHCVNVCVYGVAIGVRLGLEGPALAELGFSCLFHDAGKARVPLALIDKPDAFTPEEWAEIRRHPALGARELLRLERPLDSALARAAVVAFEHHLGADGKGYPRLPRARRQNVYSRICAIADAFDALTSGRVYAKRALTPHEAVLRMAQHAASAFDLLLFRLFIGAVGVYPIGTVLRLDTGERAVVARNAPGTLLAPRLVLLGPDAAPAGTADLGELDARTSLPLRRVESALDARREHLDPAALLATKP